MAVSIPTIELVRRDALDEATLQDVVSLAVGDRVQLAEWDVESIPYQPGSPATGALLRVSGDTTNGRAWSVFLKVLHHVRHWPHLTMLPSEGQAAFADFFPWRGELAAWEPPFADHLPSGLRLPRLYRLVDLGDDRLAVWMEDIRSPDSPWDVQRFRRAAFALGGLAALRSDPAILATSDYAPGVPLRLYVASRVRDGVWPLLDDDDIWRHPLVADAVDDRLRRDLQSLRTRVETMLDRLDQLPQALPHGDASPQNLLVPADDPESFVAIDISFQAPHAVGFDLGQLLVGLVHAGEMPASALGQVHEQLVPAFVAGMQECGVDVDPADVRYGYVATLALRSGFSSLPFERLGEPVSTDLAAAFRERAALTRFIVDQWLDLD